MKYLNHCKTCGTAETKAGPHSNLIELHDGSHVCVACMLKRAEEKK